MEQCILAKDVLLSGGLGETRPNDNQIVFGGPGTGKSVSILLPTLYNTKESSLIGTFAKRSIVSNAVAFFKHIKYNTYVWNLANSGREESIPDPLSYISTDDDVQEIARQIANGNPKYQHTIKSDPYWIEASEALMTGLICYIRMKEQNPSMKKVLNLFYKLKIKEEGKGISTSLDSQFELLERKAPDSIAVRKFNSFTQLPYSTAGCIYDNLEKAIQNIFPSSIQSAMSEEAYVDFENFATNRTAIFIITSPVKTIQYGFANLMFGIVIHKLMEFAENQDNKRLPRNVKLFFDDFSCGFPIQNYEKLLSSFREAGISSMMLCQSLSQLDATYGHDNSMVILDNCSSLVYFPGGMNRNTCSYISGIINLPLKEIMFMEMGKVVVFQSGKKPIIAPRYDTLNDPLYWKFMASGS